MKVFLPHSTKDGDFVEKLATTLESKIPTPPKEGGVGHAADQLGLGGVFVLLELERLRYSPLRFTFKPQPQIPFCWTVADPFRNVTRTVQFLSSEGW